MKYWIKLIWIKTNIAILKPFIKLEELGDKYEKWRWEKAIELEAKLKEFKEKKAG